MSRPLAICVEDLEPRSPGTRYLRCTVLPGAQPGLRLDRAGTVLWKSDEAVACELCISLDDKLILLRPEGGAPVVVRREGRWLDVPAGKPVVLLDQDQVEVGGRRVRLHVHGRTRRIAAPSYLPVPKGQAAPRAAAAAVALGAALGAADCAKKPADAVQDAVAPPPESTTQPAAEVATPPAGLDGGPTIDTTPPIEVRVEPPKVPVSRDDADTDGREQGADEGDAGTPAVDAAPVPDASPEAEPEPDDAWDAPAADDARRRRDAAPIEIRERPPVAVPIGERFKK